MEAGTGTLYIRAFTGEEAIPIENAEINVRGVDKDNSDLVFFVTTDRNGLSPVLTLQTPNLDYSLSPGQSVIPYSKYDVTVEKSGYYTKLINDVAIFPGTNALLPINMIPITPGSNAPFDSNNSTVTENDKLY